MTEYPLIKRMNMCTSRWKPTAI